MFGTDYLAGSYFFYDFFADRFGAGTLPKWVPYVYGGMPVYANPGSAYHPVHLLAETLLPTGKVLGAIFVVQFWLAGLGMYLLARELGCRAWVAFVAGIAFQFTGVTMSWVYAGHDGRIMVSTMAPLFFYFLHRGVRTGSVAPFAGAAATLGFALLSFQIQNSYYLILAGFIWAVFLLFHFGLHRRPAALGKTVALGFGAVAFGVPARVRQLPPLPRLRGRVAAGDAGRARLRLLRLVLHAARGACGDGRAGAGGRVAAGPGDGPRRSFPPTAWRAGSGCTRSTWARSSSSSWRWASSSRGAARYWWFFGGLALFALSMALGGNTPLYRLYYAVLPGLNRFRAPDLTYYVAAFSLVVMAALTLERLAELRAETAARRVGAKDESGLPMLLWIGLGVVAVALLGAMMSGGGTMGEPSRAAGWMRFALFAGAVTAVLWAWTAGKMMSTVTALLLALVTLSDLWIIDRRFFHTTQGPAQAFAPDDVVDFLAAQPQPNRVWAFPYPAGLGARRAERRRLSYAARHRAGGRRASQSPAALGAVRGRGPAGHHGLAQLPGPAGQPGRRADAGRRGDRLQSAPGAAGGGERALHREHGAAAAPPPARGAPRHGAGLREHGRAGPRLPRARRAEAAGGRDPAGDDGGRMEPGADGVRAGGCGREPARRTR